MYETILNLHRHTKLCTWVIMNIYPPLAPQPGKKQGAHYPNEKNDRQSYLFLKKKVK